MCTANSVILRMQFGTPFFGELEIETYVHVCACCHLCIRTILRKDSRDNELKKTRTYAVI